MKSRARDWPCAKKDKPFVDKWKPEGSKSKGDGL
jgi:hypothetical protein